MGKTDIDLMIALDDYAVAPSGTSVVPVTNRDKRVTGRAGRLDFLKARKPKYILPGDLDSFSRASATRLLDSNGLQIRERMVCDGRQNQAAYRR